MKIIKVGIGIMTLLAAINRYRASLGQMTAVQKNLETTAEQIDRPGRGGARGTGSNPSRYRTKVYDNDRQEWEQRMRSRSY